MSGTISFDPLPQEVREAIAAELATHPGHLVENRRKVRLALTYSLQVWILHRWVINLYDPAGNHRLDTLATHVGIWHHQITRSGKPVVYALTMPSRGGSGESMMIELTRGRFAGAVASALDWIDRTIAEDYTVRLLRIPEHQIAALWLRGPEKDLLTVVDRPTGVTEPPFEQALSVPDFLASIKRFAV
jgi:hypothetical protein